MLTLPVYDYVVIGSGFGGSVAALRLSEKGYKVAVIEQGKRFLNKDYPRSDWNLRKFLFIPSMGFNGFLRCHFFRQAFILSGAGVGGGSLVYANTLMQPPPEFYQNPGWPAKFNWHDLLSPHFETARQMMGSTLFPSADNEEDTLFQEVAHDLGRGHTFSRVETGVYYGDPDFETDPYFGGEGPLRKGCIHCAGCMTGCRENAKNTLDKNYLFFAEKNGAQIFPGTKVFRLDFDHEIYTISTKHLLKGGFKGIIQTKGIVVSAGVLGTLELLFMQKYKYKTLPGLSSSLGNNVRTNSQSISGIAGTSRKLNNGVAITSIFSPVPGTHVEMVKFNDPSGAMTHLSGFAVDALTPSKRVFRLLSETLRHPARMIRLLFSFRWGDKSIVLLVMQNCNKAMKMEWRKVFIGSGLRFSREAEKIPAFIPEGQEVLYRYAQKVNGVPMNSITETMFNMSTTAHIIGGCPIGSCVADSVVDECFRVHGYPDMYILDGSLIPCNPGVNPSLTILAMSEYAMSLVPDASSK